MNDETMNTQEAVALPAESEVAEVSTSEMPSGEIAAETTPEAAPEAVAETPASAEVQTPAVAERTDASAPANPLDAVKLREHFKGKVARTDLGGAFVDIGIGVEGFIHISQMVSDKPVTRVADFLKPGDEVDVYAARINAARKRIDLTMIKPPVFDWDNLEVGRQLNDVKVVAVESFGAFVDIDGPKHGLVPFNLMPKGDRPKVGDLIPIVWVIEVNQDKRRIGLTMIEPAIVPWERIRKGEQHTGRVTRIERNGAYVDIGAEREGLIRTSSLGGGFVNMSTMVTVGEQVTVHIAKVDTQRKQIDLTLDGMETEDFSLSSGPDEVISPFAVAMQRAQKVKKAQDRIAAAKKN